jgi:uncharacterized Fe-S cluster protein YjdI
MEPKTLIKKYTNGEITIVWKPAVCVHSMVCWKAATGLPEMFNLKISQWIQMEHSTSEKITEQVKKCPS